MGRYPIDLLSRALFRPRSMDFSLNLMGLLLIYFEHVSEFDTLLVQEIITQITVTWEN